MASLNRLFTGYMGGGTHVAKNGKFSTTKNNHNRNKNGSPTVIFAYSKRLIKIWCGKNINKFTNDEYSLNQLNSNNLPSYMNPVYHPAYHQSKHRR